MSEDVFSKHVKSRLDGTFDNSPEILGHLKRELRRQLKLMGQWHLPPRYLAFDGESWEHSDALDELTNEVYIHCIEKRLLKLAEHLAVTGTCEGSVRKKIRWFLQDRQEKGNPISRRVFRNVCSASESLIDREKAVSEPVGKLRSQTAVLAIGRSVPNSNGELLAWFSESLADGDIVSRICRNCPASWRIVELVIENSFNSGLSGYLIGELVKIFAEKCAGPSRIVDISDDTDAGFGNIWDLISKNRTDISPGRYLEKNEVDERDQFEALVRDLRACADKNISNARIRARVLNMIEQIAALVREGEDIRELTCRKLAAILQVSKSTVDEDLARLNDQVYAQRALNNRATI